MTALRHLRHFTGNFAWCYLVITCTPPARRCGIVALLAMVDFSELITLLYAVGNVTSSVTLVLLNKRVFSNGFFYPMTLSFFHFVFTIGFYEALRVCGVYVRPEQQMPRFEKFKVAFAGFASIGFMNLSLTYNSVGFYQVPKLLYNPTPKPQP